MFSSQTFSLVYGTIDTFRHRDGSIACPDRLLKYLGFFIASWLAVFSFFGGVLDMALLAIPGVLVVVWLALMGWRYKPLP